jgi:hypothetical protein
VPIKGDPPLSNGDFGEFWAHLVIEPISVHAQVGGGIAVADQAWEQQGWVGREVVSVSASAIPSMAAARHL